MHNTYKIEHKISTIAECAVHNSVDGTYSVFSIDGITFSQWEFNHSEGWTGDAWLASGYIDENNFIQAINSFQTKLSKIVSRISLISQCEIEYLFEPFVVYKENSEFAFFRYVQDRGHTGLMFTEAEELALSILLTDTKIPREFYYYWNDAVNVTGYSAKLLLMFSAVEALVKKPNGKKDWDLLEKILGSVLKEKLFGTPEKPDTGLRHRLVHGQYFNSFEDSTTNYLDEVHKKVVSYFNTNILKQSLIREDVVNPQRHTQGNRIHWQRFIQKANHRTTFDLKMVIDECDDYREGFSQNKTYNLVINEEKLRETY